MDNTLCIAPWIRNHPFRAALEITRESATLVTHSTIIGILRLMVPGLLP